MTASARRATGPAAGPPAPAPTTAPAPSAAAGGPEPRAPRSFHDIPGWFYNGDLVLFDWFLDRQRRLGLRGDLLEMGAYLGRSAVMMHGYLRPGETFTVCDLFGTEAPSEGNGQETRGSYATLTRRAFETNFLAFHDELPHIIQAPTSVVPERVAAGSCRFVHVDASHLYEHVRPDIAAARASLTGDGLVALDDYRSDHTPGVACATWQAVLEDGLRPVCVSGQKFYGTWGDAAAVQEELHAALRERGDCWLQWQQVAGRRVLLVGGRKAAPPRLPVARHAATAPARTAVREEAPGGREAGRGGRRPAAGPMGPVVRRRAAALVRRGAREVLPPVLARPLARALRARRG